MRNFLSKIESILLLKIPEAAFGFFLIALPLFYFFDENSPHLAMSQLFYGTLLLLQGAVFIFICFIKNIKFRCVGWFVFGVLGVAFLYFDYADLNLRSKVLFYVYMLIAVGAFGCTGLPLEKMMENTKNQTRIRSKGEQ